MFGILRTKTKGFCSFVDLRDFFKRYNKEITLKEAKEFVQKISRKKNTDFFSIQELRIYLTNESTLSS